MVVSLSVFFIFAVNLPLLEAFGQQPSRYCQVLAEEAEALEADWVTQHSERLQMNEALMAAEYVFDPIYKVQLTPQMIATPNSHEMCRRANTALSKKAASLCYCRGSQSYRYSPFATLDNCEILRDEETGQMYAYMVGLVECF